MKRSASFRIPDEHAYLADRTVVPLRDSQEYWSIFRQYLALCETHLLAKHYLLRPLGDLVTHYALPDNYWESHRGMKEDRLFPHSLFDRQRGFSVVSRDRAMIIWKSFAGYFCDGDLDEHVALRMNYSVNWDLLIRLRRAWDKEFRTTLSGESYEL